MPLILSNRNLQASYPSSYKLSVNCSQSSSWGYKRSINLHHGLHLLIRDYQLQEPLFEETLHPYPALELEFGFNLCGKPHNQSSFSNPGSFLHYEQTTSRTIVGEWLPGQRVLKIDLHLTAPRDSKTLSALQLDLIPQELRHRLENPDSEFYTDLGVPTPEVRLVLQQILNCPYQGGIEQVYLQAKGLELIALQSAQALQHDFQPQPQTQNLKPANIERLYQARDLLLSNLDNPPSLLDLARRVGLNDCTLKREFRQLFGTTVFGYLRKYRMLQARQLLLDNKMSVAEVACTVGYAHPGYFAAAFRREFGVCPGSLR